MEDGEQPVELLTDGLFKKKKFLRAPTSYDLMPQQRSPRNGWRPLEPVDAAVYFGRDAHIAQRAGTSRKMACGGPREAVLHCPRPVGGGEVIVSAGRSVATPAPRRPPISDDGLWCAL